MPFMSPRRIYILLTRSQTMLSKTIHLFTGDEYTHVSIAFDGELESLCSFARRYARLPLPAGLVTEALDGGYFERHPDMPCALYSLTVPETVYSEIRSRARQMLAQREEYRYSIRGLAMCRLGIPQDRPQHYFCSQFVAELLEASGAVWLPKPPSLMRPQDFGALSELRLVYRGELAGLARQITQVRPGRGTEVQRAMAVQ